MGKLPESLRIEWFPGLPDLCQERERVVGPPGCNDPL